MRCIWCDHETTSDKSAATDKIRYANKEHIFPEAVGGRKCLTQGLVCKQCNDDLGRDVDQYLKTSNMSMMYQYQIVDGLPGKSRGKEDRLRKVAQKAEIQHYDGASVVKTTNDKSSTSFLDSQFYMYDKAFSRAVHKCLLNTLLDSRAEVNLPKSLEALKNYILTGDDEEPGWAIGLAYARIWNRYDFEPFCQSFILDASGCVVAGVLVFPSLLAIVGCNPDVINKEFLWLQSRHLYKTWRAHSADSAFDIASYFKADAFLKLFGRKPAYEKISIIHVRKPNRGAPIRGKLHRLMSCVHCGQVNTTGVAYDKAKVLQQSNHCHVGSKNDWNSYEPEDMSLIFDASYTQYFDRNFQNFQDSGIQVDSKKLDSLRATWSVQTICCIGCGGYTYAQPKDFFF